MKKEYFILSLMIILLIGFTSASELENPIKLNEEVTLYQMCSTCTYVNITSITYPDSTVELINKEMTKSGTDYYYYFNKTYKVGTYKYNVCGDKDSIFTCEVISFKVNPTGLLNTLGFHFLILILSLGVIIVGFYIRDAIITILGSFGLYFVGIYTLFFGIDGIKDATYTWALGIIVLMLAAYISIRSSIELITD